MRNRANVTTARVFAFDIRELKELQFMETGLVLLLIALKINHGSMTSDPTTRTAVPPIRIMSIEQTCGACFRNGSIRVTFSASQCAYEGVTGFIVNCSGSTCISERVECPATGNVSVLTNTLGAKCGSHEVNVYVVNRTSDPATRTVGAPTDECLTLLVVSVMLIVLYCFLIFGVLYSHYYMKKKFIDEPDKRNKPMVEDIKRMTSQVNELLSTIKDTSQT